MTPHKGQHFAGDSPRVLDNHVAPAGVVSHVIDEQGSAAGGGAEWEERVEHVLHNSVLLGNQVRRVVLDELGLADELGEEGDEGLLVEVA